MASSQPLGNLAHLLPPSWKSIITQWLDEDTPSFDYGGFVVGESEEQAQLLCKSDGILAGIPFVNEVFHQLGCNVEWFFEEGQLIQPSLTKHKVQVAKVIGKARFLLLGERVALNILCRCSGIATRSRELLNLARESGYKGIIAGTRKTTPGFRIIEKYGMLVAGIDPHRYDLSSMVMLKDNHIWSKGGIRQAIESAQKVCGFGLRIDVEVRNQCEAIEAITSGADVIMLDNFTPDAVKVTAKLLKDKYKTTHQFLIEVSGGLTASNLSQHISNEVDIYSTSSVHQGVPTIDFSLKIVPKTDHFKNQVTSP